jgi:hypothetical protein
MESGASVQFGAPGTAVCALFSSRWQALQRADPAKKVALVIQFPAKNAPAREHPAVTLLARWANEEAGMDVSFPAAKK